MRIYLRQSRGRLSPENAKKGKSRKISLYLVFDYGQRKMQNWVSCIFQIAG